VSIEFSRKNLLHPIGSTGTTVGRTWVWSLRKGKEQKGKSCLGTAACIQTRYFTCLMSLIRTTARYTTVLKRTQFKNVVLCSHEMFLFLPRGDRSASVIICLWSYQPTTVTQCRAEEWLVLQVLHMAESRHVHTAHNCHHLLLQHKNLKWDLQEVPVSFTAHEV
jgi:hypothetical protein